MNTPTLSSDKKIPMELAHARLSLLCVLILFITGCATPIVKKPDYVVQRRFGRYRVISPDHNVVVFLSRRVGKYRGDLSSKDGAMFVNHEFHGDLSYLVRVSFTASQLKELHLAPMTEAEIATMKSTDGRQKHVEHQHVGETSQWGLQFYSYPMDYDFEGRHYARTMQCLELVRLVAGKIVMVETSLAYEGGYDPKFEKIATSFIKDYALKQERTN
ncbi:MAG TPA: hypothetical protein VG710_04640 [Opitutus sp.]|nr:hypothetical protein [Opitutus sp.]